jgi:alpha-glucosidase
MGSEGRTGRRAWMRVLPAAAIALWLLPASSAGAEQVVDSGSLRADAGADPWTLSFTDAAGATVLAQDPGTGSGPSGTLGFRTATGWQHATRVLEQQPIGAGGYAATLATTDPAGRTIELQLTPSGEGVIALDARIGGGAPAADVEAIGIAFSAREGERYLGFGERSDAVDQRGNSVENYVSDGPYQQFEYPFLSAFVPPWGLRDRADATYFPIPWLLSSAGYGVLVDNPETSVFRLGSDDEGAWSAEVLKAPAGVAGAEGAAPPTRLQMRVFAGPTPADALRRFTSAVGRQPLPAAPWVYGAWYQDDNPEGEGVAALRAADVPVSALQTYLHYLPCGDQRGVEGEQPARTAAAHAEGLAITTYFNPMVCSNYGAAYGPAAAAGALTRTVAGAPYLYRYGASPTDANVVGQYDFFKPRGRELYGQRLQEAVDAGYDGWMEDFGEYTPLDSASGPGTGIGGSRAHNPYPAKYHCAAYDAIKDAAHPIVRFQRSGWTGAARCAQVVWGGDPTVGWDFDGLRSAVKQALSMGLSGISVWGSDIGGFFAIGRELSPELLMRWVQFGAVSAVMRTQRNGVALPPIDRPQVEDPDQIANWRRYAKLHTRLYPYTLAAQAQYRHTGMPLMRQLALAYPGRSALAGREDEYLFGPDLLAAPVLEPGARERELALPPGRWIDLWRSARYRENDGGLTLTGAKPIRGGRKLTVPAPLEELPLMVRAGSVLPLLAADVDTLASTAGEGGDDDLVTLRDRRGRMSLLAFPRGSTVSRFNRGERLLSSEGGVTGVGRGATTQRLWQLQVRGKRMRGYHLQAAFGAMLKPFRPCTVSLDNRRLPHKAWSYDRRSQVLKAVFRTRNGTLTAAGCS